MHSIGIYFGTFAPCHIGHFEQIIRAKREHSHALVIVSGYEGDRGDEYDMSLDRRVKAMRELVDNDPYVSVLKLDETNIPRYPHGWQPWLEALEILINNEVSKLEFSMSEATFYVGEDEYIEPLNNYFNHAWPTVSLFITKLDRKILGISGTDIREHPLLNWDYITRPFRKFFVQNVLVLSTDEVKRRQLVNDLAKRFSTSYSESFYEAYMRKGHLKPDELDLKDYHAIGVGQYALNREHIHSPATRKVFFANSNAILTKVHMHKNFDNETYHQLDQVFNYYLHLEQWEIIFIIETDDDLHVKMMDEIDQLNLTDKVIRLKGDAYEDVYEAAVRQIHALLDNGNDISYHF